uniref:NADH:ubiquinone reductase (H(+)-translocating) n=1 Tax=Walchia hayashii TaxID=436352 RepID=B3IUL0_9ACAR|nr:NADH dehydrogenase subunit 5 [Walchia hayashii]BAG24164.1 NADH dehydrogenase subunit 5 [Walchia hayashii]
MVYLLFSSFLFFHFLLLSFSFSFSSFMLEVDFFSFFSSSISLVFSFDWISFIFSSFVVFISSIIIIYSGYYMKGDSFFIRFIFILVLFVISMVFLIFGGNFFMIMIGWDGLGLVSFCLVIYYSDKDALVSGILTVLMNRVGDGLILLSIFYFNLMSGFSLDLFFMSGVGCFFLLCSFLTKSAQFPFSSWLPAAMSAPTPISSLVHSSTLVTAGIYLSIRFNFIFVGSFCSLLLMILSLLTMILGGFLANFEMDFKSIVAMSTLSQLGLLFFLISIGFVKLAFFHMVSHAFFKSLLFMGTGGVIINGSQDSRLKGSYLLFSPVLFSVMFVSLFSLLAVPFSVGFYSSDLALDFMFCGNLIFFIYLFFLVGCLSTVFYSFRIMFFVFSFVCGKGVLDLNCVSYFLYFSSLLGIFLTLYWGKFVYTMVLMEDFVLISYPLKMIGVILLFLGLFSFVGGKVFSFFISLMILFKYFLFKLFFFDYYFKFDQVWIEGFLQTKLNRMIDFSVYFFDLDFKVLWVSFVSIWFFILFFLSTTT